MQMIIRTFIVDRVVFVLLVCPTCDTRFLMPEDKFLPHLYSGSPRYIFCPFSHAITIGRVQEDEARMRRRMNALIEDAVEKD